MLISKRKKALILRVRDPERILSVIPKAKKLVFKGKEYVVVPHRRDEVKVLNNIGIDAPSPMLYYYDWPGRYPPFEAQRTTAAFMSGHDRCFNLNDLGTGKTLATLWAYDYLRSIGVVKKALVISPLSTLERAWGDDLFNHFAHLTFSVLHGTREKRLKLLETDVDLYVINHDGLKVNGLVDAINARNDIDLVIIDEVSQAARTASSDRWKSLAKVVRHEVEKGRQRMAWGLTGTPVPNSPTDAWAQCRLIVPHKVPPYFTSFKNQVMRQVSQFAWLPREEAQDIVFEAMQPAIRFKRDEVVDLPPCTYVERTVELTAAQKKAYKEMVNKLQAEFDSGEVTAVNEAVKAQKLIQILCIGYNTPVLTELGWIPIQEVPANVRVWDGIEWVNHRGLAYKGVKRVIKCDGVYMTPDHEVLTESGWKPAKEIVYGQTCEGLNRVAVRLPDGDTSRRFYNANGGILETSNLAVSMRLWERSGTSEPVSPHETPHYAEELRVPSRQRTTQALESSDVQNVGRNETSLPKRVRQGLEELRGAWNQGVRAVGEFIRQLSGGYASNLAEGAYPRSHQRERSIFSGELPVGYCETAGEQHSRKYDTENPSWGNDAHASCGTLRVKGDNAVRKDQSIQVACGKSLFNSGHRQVFDLIDCGPRNRFVVRGENGELIIVHNCGAVYGKDGEEHYVDAKPRYEAVREACEESGSKTIVFVPFVSMVKPLSEFLEKSGFSVEKIYGDVSKGERDRIFSSFQKLKDPQVIVAIPQAMSHGLTLTAASTIVWAAPITNNDTFEQANARVSRPGQKLNQLIVMIEGSPIERKYYQRLKEKGRVQGILLDLVQNNRKEKVA